jgi:hypothetical protein
LNDSVLNSSTLDRSTYIAARVSPYKSPRKSIYTQNVQHYIDNNEVSYSPDINKQIAKELYIDSAVNVVKGKGKKAVKPGQMNLF